MKPAPRSLALVAAVDLVAVAVAVVGVPVAASEIAGSSHRKYKLGLLSSR
jgi:hypothetical protein